MRRSSQEQCMNLWGLRWLVDDDGDAHIVSLKEKNDEQSPENMMTLTFLPVKSKQRGLKNRGQILRCCFAKKFEAWCAVYMVQQVVSSVLVQEYTWSVFQIVSCHLGNLGEELWEIDCIVRKCWNMLFDAVCVWVKVSTYLSSKAEYRRGIHGLSIKVNTQHVQWFPARCPGGGWVDSRQAQFAAKASGFLHFKYSKCPFESVWVFVRLIDLAKHPAFCPHTAETSIYIHHDLRTVTWC